MESHDPAPRPSTHRGLGLTLAACLVVAWLVYVRVVLPRVSGPGELTPAPLSAPSQPLQTDYRWELRGIDGQPFDFTSMRDKVVFLNVWASWCPPCRAEMPSILALAGRAELKEAVFLLVGVNDGPDELRRFLGPELVERPVKALVAGGPNPTFDSEAIPATFILDRSGRVVIRHMGAANWDTPEVAGFLEKLLKTKAP